MYGIGNGWSRSWYAWGWYSGRQVIFWVTILIMIWLTGLVQRSRAALNSFNCRYLKLWCRWSMMINLTSQSDIPELAEGCMSCDQCWIAKTQSWDHTLGHSSEVGWGCCFLVRSHSCFCKDIDWDYSLINELCHSLFHKTRHNISISATFRKLIFSLTFFFAPSLLSCGAIFFHYFHISLW